MSTSETEFDTFISAAVFLSDLALFLFKSLLDARSHFDAILEIDSANEQLGKDLDG
jgi:hypothetical protein